MNETTLGAARSHYYQVKGFGSDGVPLKLWKLTLKIPNTEGRRKAVRLHDLHHDRYAATAPKATAYRMSLDEANERASVVKKK